MSKQSFTVGDVVALDRDCDIGKQGERAVVLSIVDVYMTLVFANRAYNNRLVLTGADYRFLKSAPRAAL